MLVAKKLHGSSKIRLWFQQKNTNAAKITVIVDFWVDGW